MNSKRYSLKRPGFRLNRCIPAFLFLIGGGLSQLTAQYTSLSPNNTFQVSEGTPVVRTVVLPEGADILRVTADWSSISGGSQSNDFSVSVVGPDGQTASIDVFDNADSSTASVNGLEGELILSSQGTAGTYTLTFESSRSSSTGEFANVQIDTELILESFTDSGLLTTGSPTWDRPDDEFLSGPSGSYYYESYSFSPSYDGDYIIDSASVGDGFIFLYTPSFDSNNPLSNGVVANDDRPTPSDQPASIGDPKMKASIPTAGVNYVLVTSSFDQNATFNFTNEIRYSVRLDQLPDTWPAFQTLNSLTSFTTDKDNDGILDGFEYAFSSDPDVAEDISSYQELVYNSGTDRLGLIFTRDDTKTDIEYIVEANNGLSPGGWGAIATLTDSTTNSAPGGDITKHEVTDATTVATAGGARFLRLRINYTGP